MSTHVTAARTAAVVGWCLLAPAAAPAGVVFDGTLGPAGARAGNFEISDADGRQVGPNLFHSFAKFDVETGESATFTSAFAGTTQSVIARVTGADASTIDGPMASTIPGASLWLVNPNGLVFGEHASLAVEGGFYASTADYLVLEDGGRFDATDIGNTRLTLANPAAFGFLDGDPAPIDVRAAALTAAAGEPLALVGGAVDVDGAALTAPGGEIDLAAVRGPGLVDLDDPAGNLTRFDAFGEVRLNSASLSADGDGGGGIYVLGGGFVALGTGITSRTSGAADGRPVRIDVDSMTLGDATHIETTTSGAGAGGSIEVHATGPVALGPQQTADGASIRSTSDAGSTGAPGGISIDAGSFDMRLSHVLVGAGGAGAGGALDLDVGGSLYVEGGFGSTLANNSATSARAGDVRVRAGDVHFVGGSILAQALGDGDGGSLTLEADSLTMENGAEFSVAALGAGRGGSIRIEVAGATLLKDNVGYPTGIFAGAAGGPGGDIDLGTGTLTMSAGAEVSSYASGAGHAGDVAVRAASIDIGGGALIDSTTYGPGDGGNVVVEATERLGVEGQAPLFTGIFANAFSDGDAGSIAVAAPEISVTNGGFIQSGSFSADPLRTGAGGDIVVDTDRLTVDAGFISARTETSGDGGSITIDASDTVSLLDSSGVAFGPTPVGGVFVSAGGILNSPVATGSAGDVTINTGRLVLRDGGVITADTFLHGDAGDITVNADVVDILAETSSYTGLFNSSGTDGRGGAIAVNAHEISIGGPAAILAGAFGAGDAGTITIDAEDLTVTGRGSIATSSAASSGGNIDVRVDGMLFLDGGTISAAAEGVTPADAGGNVSIDPQFVVLRGSGILASANAGNGGNIGIRAGAFVIDTSSRIDASSTTGLDGRILIDSPHQITGAVDPLATPAPAVSAFIAERCVPEIPSQRSTLVAETTARKAAPTTDYLASPHASAPAPQVGGENRAPAPDAKIKMADAGGPVKKAAGCYETLRERPR